MVTPLVVALAIKLLIRYGQIGIAAEGFLAMVIGTLVHKGKLGKVVSLVLLHFSICKLLGKVGKLVRGGVVDS